MTDTTSGQTIDVSRAGGVTTITLSRPKKKNAVDAVMWAELLAAFVDFEQRPSDLVLVVTGAGGSFCAGQDLSSRSELHPLVRMREVTDVALTLHRLSKPTVAKVRGVAVGAGCNLALHCDLVVANEEARFSEIFARRGLSLDFGGSWILPRLVGLSRAKELAMLGDFVSGEQAAAMGLVNRAVPDSELDDLVDGWARSLAAGPPIALRQTKSMLNNSHRLSMDQALEDEGRAQAVNLATEDAAEAREAFLNKRDVSFTGRSAILER